ncbi:MAG: hypothetical protein M0Q38_14005 [Bacteroidales bacterium]|jgi:hypothetical protein|nr:hypothetical protein [Bacteroidales bacterium]
MSDLEKFIKDHREEFDTFEPSPDHFKKFETLLQQQPEVLQPGINRFMMLKIAALILVLITVSVFVFDLATKGIRDRLNNRNAGTELPLEVKEVVQYYDIQVAERFGQIQKLASSNEEARMLNSNAIREIQNLDVSTDELKKSLAENPNNERLLAALIQNQQMKEGIMNNIINKLIQAGK